MVVYAGKGWGLGHCGQPGQLWTVGGGEGRGEEGRGGGGNRGAAEEIEMWSEKGGEGERGGVDGWCCFV